MRTLRRPMFRRGGSTGGGITSGLSRPGYKRGRVVEPGGYQGNIDPSSLLKGYGDFKKAYDKQVGPRPRSTNLNDFLINFGLNMVGNAPSGNILQTAATQAKEPFGQFQQRKAYEQEAPREEERDLVKAYMSAKGEALSGGAIQQKYKDEKMAGLAREANQALWDLNESWKDEWNSISEEERALDPDYKDWRKKQRDIDSDLDHYTTSDGVSISDIIGGSQGMIELQDKFKASVLTGEYGEQDMIGPDGQAMVDEDTGETITISEYYTDRPGELREKIITMTGTYIDKLKKQRRGWKGSKAEGGRAGYRTGTLVEQEDVNIQTPQGDVAMQETIEEGADPDQLSYEELRSRLPVEITDDIVRLMVSSPEALTDFAELQTQVDVDRFNAKYGVNLVLPSEA